MDWRSWWYKLRKDSPLKYAVRDGPSLSAQTSCSLFLVVEGEHDIAFLRRISTVLYRAGETAIDLSSLEQLGRIILVPTGGDVLRWIARLANTAQAEFHLYDREQPPLTNERLEAAAIINTRTRCRAAVTSKRGLENFLHPHAIRETFGLEVAFGDDDDVADLVAKRRYEQKLSVVAWNDLPANARKRARNRAKQRLNTIAVERMTPQLLVERDPRGEVLGWFRAIDELLVS